MSRIYHLIFLVIFSKKLVKKLNKITAIAKSPATKKIKDGDNITSENSSLKNTIPNINITIKKVKSNLLKLLKGVHILYKSINPVIPVIITHKVDISSDVSLIKEGSTIIIIIFAVIVSAVGTEFFKTLEIILPFIRSLLGSKARIKEGMPIVTILVSVS